ncbi:MULTISPECIES: response regulator [unclassified Herbaspirillum]|uniref:response regulator n=1 Tax=unclassified Herbaspirillum TaxID=2624150 RepID=UPI00114DA299|nr:MULTISPECIES: response regulator [unclassified Herbaspirillum]MBB5392135.1 two-component system OmpR family response regulator [Herbaspirillum sp. SJZ102]
MEYPPDADRHILVVDDHLDICEPLAAYLRRQGMLVSMAFNAAQARRLLQRQAFDLALLDVMMPGEDGLSLCRHIGERYGTPVILLTAMSSSADKVNGLETGADDYIVKPFEPQELVARIKTVLRRIARSLPAATNPGHSAIHRYRFGQWTLDLERRELRGRDGTATPLSSVEYRLLCALVAHPNTVLSRDKLLDLTAGADAQAFDRSIDSQVSRLRKKLEADPRHPSLLKTVWGNGYLFAAQVRAEPHLP